MSRPRSSPFAAGVSVFAGVLLLTTSAFQALEGLAAVLEDEVFVRGVQYTYRFDVTTWGWIHLIVGALGIAVAIGILGGRAWALLAGMCLAVVGALTQFLFLPYYPFWAILVIAMYILVIWALGDQFTEAD